MLLTLKQPSSHSSHSFHKPSYEYSPPTPPSTSRFSPAIAVGVLPYPTSTSSFRPLQVSESMSTPHRGLPPPAAMIPQSSQGPPVHGHAQSSSQPMILPPAPREWHGQEDAMRDWLHAKSEEDKRIQEQEKTQQEALRLEQRRIENDMLRTSLSGGIPPYMVPMVFVGIGGGNLPAASLEWAQHYMSQAAQQAQLPQQDQRQSALLPSQSQPSPELRREARHIGHGPAVPQHALPPPMPSTSSASLASTQQNSTYVPSYQMSPSRSRASLPTSQILTRTPQTGQLLRLNTNEMHIQQPPSAPAATQLIPGQPAHPLQQTQNASSQQETQSSPSIYFHHWQPPTSQSGSGTSNQPGASADMPSPKKRKAQGPQERAPPPTSQPQYTSPPFSSQGGSSTSGTPSVRRRHSRQRSEFSSSRVADYGRPGSRHRAHESSYGSQSGESPGPRQGYETVSDRASTAREALHAPKTDAYDTRPLRREREYSSGPDHNYTTERNSPKREQR